MTPSIKLAQKPSSNTQLRPQPTHRQYWLDNFRTYLAVLVVYHHTAVAYGGEGSWTYISLSHPPMSSLPLVAFNVVDQSYFMAAFFFLSGYLSSVTVQKKTKKAFLKDKMLKLGLPALVYTFLGEPIQHAIMASLLALPYDWTMLWQYWTSIRGIHGPVWYCAVLLIFDMLYLCYLAVTRRNTSPNAPKKAINLYSFITILTGIAIIVIASFSIRLRYPADTIFVPLNLRLAFLPQYIAAYVLGTSTMSSSTADFLPSGLLSYLVPASLGSLIIALFLLVVLPAEYNLASAAGGWNHVALCYEIWNETTGYLLFASVLLLFRKYADRKWWNLGRYSYAAFLVHPIASVAVEAAADGWDASGVVKTAIVGTVNVLASWLLGWLLMKVPGVGRVV